MSVRVTYVVMRPHGQQTATLVSELVGDPCFAEAVVLEERAAYAHSATFAIVWVEGELKRSPNKNKYGPNWFYRIAYAPEHLQNVDKDLEVPESAKEAVVIFVRKLSDDDLKARKDAFKKAICRMHRRCKRLVERKITSRFIEAENLAA